MIFYFNLGDGFSSKEDVLPLFWKSGREPDAVPNYCMALDKEGWSSSLCEKPKPFICEYDIISTPDTTQLPDTGIVFYFSIVYKLFRVN